jgi:uncharacterized membrane protein
MTETKFRTLVRVVGWRLIGIVIASTIAYHFIGDIGKTLTCSAIITALNIVTAFFYERAWLRLGWGMTTKNQMDEQDML